MTAFYDRNKLHNEGKAGLERWKRAKSGNSAFEFSSKFLKSQIWMNPSRVVQYQYCSFSSSHEILRREQKVVDSGLFVVRDQEPREAGLQHRSKHRWQPPYMHTGGGRGGPTRPNDRSIRSWSSVSYSSLKFGRASQWVVC